MTWCPESGQSIYFLASQRGKKFRVTCHPPLSPVASPRLIVRLAALPSFSPPSSELLLKILELYNGVLTLQTLGCVSTKRKPKGVCATLGDSFRIIFFLLKENTFKLRYSRKCLFFSRTMTSFVPCFAKKVSLQIQTTPISQMREVMATPMGWNGCLLALSDFFSSSVFVLTQAQSKAKQSY